MIGYVLEVAQAALALLLAPGLVGLIRWMKETFRLTILLIEHQMDLVMGLCERLLVLDFGVTIAAGLPEEIRRNPKVLESYLGQEVAT